MRNLNDVFLIKRTPINLLILVGLHLCNNHINI